MQKVVLPVVVAAVVVFAVLPAAFGWLGGSGLPEQVERIDASPVYTAELVSHERGWFGSVLVVELGLEPAYAAQFETLPGPTGEPVGAGWLSRPLTVRADVTHGPVLFAGGPALGWAAAVVTPAPNDPLAVEIEQTLGMAYLFELDTQTGFGGAIEYALDVPAVDYASAESELVSTGLDARGRVDGRRNVVEATLESLSYTVGPAVLSLTGLAVSGDAEHVSTYQLIGDFEATLDRFSVADAIAAQGLLLDVTGIAFSSSADLDSTGELMSGTMRYTAESILAGDDVEITGAELAATFENVDSDAVGEYVEIMQGLAAADETDATVLVERIEPIVGRLLAAGPTVTVAPIAFTMNGEPFEAEIGLNVVPETLPPPGSLDITDPMLWMQSLTGSLVASASKPLAEVLAVQTIQTQLAAGQNIPPEQIAPMAEAQAAFLLITLAGQGIIVDDGDRYRTRIVFENGELTINDAPLPLGL